MEKIVLKRIFLILVGVLILSPLMTSRAEEMNEKLTIDTKAMMQEVKSRVNATKEPHPWVTDIVEKYIPMETDQEVLLQWCKDQDFEVKDLTSRDYNKNKLDQYDSIQKCSKYFWIPKGWFWKHGLGMSFDFEKGQLRNIRARVGYTHPWY